jgi:hypothetical protein
MQGQPNVDVAGYLVLILYKVYIYVNVYVDMHDADNNEDYFKNYLIFMSRENNGSLYRKLKAVVKTSMKMSDKVAAKYILDLVNQPDIIGKYIYVKPENHAAAARASPPTRARTFGDPMVSFVSYFNFFEKRGEINDWLVYDEIDVFTGSGGAGFKDDTLLIENRWFFDEMRTYLNLEQDIHVEKYMELGDLQRIYTQLVTNKKVVKDIDAKVSVKSATKSKRRQKRCPAGSRRNKKTGACDKM